MLAELLSSSLGLYGLTGVLGVFLIYWFFLKDSSSSSSSKSTTAANETSKPAENTEDDESKPKMLILYGSQTGTAEEFSYTLAAEAKRYGFRPQVVDLVDFDSPSDTLPENQLVILVVATYGEGEPTDNARDFFEWIKDESLPKDLLNGVNFAVFGLGNKQYKIYQAVARFFDKRMEEIGATRAFEKGEGDADENLEEDFEDWKSRMLPELSEKFETKAELGEEKIEQKFEMKYYADTLENASLPFDTPKGIPDAKMPFFSKVRVNKQLLVGCVDRSTVHVEFEIKGSRISYEAGDHLAVYAKNDDALVKAYIDRLGYGEVLTKVFALLPRKDKSKPPHFPKKCTIGTAIKHYLDLTGLPRKKFIRVLALSASDPVEKEKLMLLSSNSNEGKAIFKTYVKDAGRIALDILNEHPSVQLPVDVFLELCPRLQPRYYSIASSSQMHSDSIHAVVAVVQYTSGMGKQKKGICSGFLETLQTGDQAYVYVRQSNFHLPRDTQKPVIMVGPGTGLAPFVGFLQQRRAAMNKGQKLGEALMFFGCRKKAEDYIYQQDLEAAEKDGVISNLQVAFSRDQAAKVYVQHKLAEHKEKIWSILEKGGIFYICGDAKYMAKDVDKVLLETVQTCGNKTPEEAAKYVDKLAASSRYLRDVWSPN